MTRDDDVWTAIRFSWYDTRHRDTDPPCLTTERGPGYTWRDGAVFRHGWPASTRVGAARTIEDATTVVAREESGR